MYDLVVDLEVDVHGDRSDPTPYNNQNILSGIGYLRIGMDTVPVCVFPDNPDGIDTFRSFDMSWLRETGFDTDAKLIDTMINQYVLNRGQRGPLSLSALAEIYGVTRKLDSLSQALDAGQNYSDLDKETQVAYLSADVLATAEIYREADRDLSGRG
jgi:hypothetical protein